MYYCKDIIAWLEKLAPPDTAEPWDHVGLMVGSVESQLNGVVFALDCTTDAIAKCVETGANLLVTHHPLIYPSISCINKDTPSGKMICDLIEKQITVYSAHTNLDRAEGGVNDALCEAIGLDTFTPFAENTIERFGTWREVRSFFSSVQRIQTTLDAPGFFMNTDKDQEIKTVLVCAGAFDEEIIPLFLDKKPDLIVSGEIKHHLMLELSGHQIAAVAMGHEPTERVILPKLKQALQAEFSDIRVEFVSGLDYNKVVFRA